MAFYIKIMPNLCKELLIVVVLFIFLFSLPVVAQAGLDQTDLTEMSLDELMNIEITSVSKKPEKLSKSSAAVFVITQEDIRRSGATSIPEVLRMVPGVQVARIDANKWAISTRGFSGRFANKLLVLIDGRSVYTPLFSGVFWDSQDTLLEDIERIEVIRGPGASLWGANAVNGVINIITKHTKDTQGGLISTGAGTEEQGFGNLRYGWKLGRNAYSRIYVKYFNRDDAVLESGSDASDGWKFLRGGFRIDWDVANHDSLTLQGDIYDGEVGQTLTIATPTPHFTRTFDDDGKISGGNVLARWKRAFTEASNMALQLYYDRTERKDAGFEDNRDIFDVDFQHQFAVGERQEIVWGLGYRFTQDDVASTFTISLDPDSRDDHLFSAFVQDDITLIKDLLRLTVGSKFEENDYTGFEIQPNARLLWTPHEQHSVWASVSRAVRTPSRADADVRLNQSVLPPGTLIPGSTVNEYISLFGDRNIESEELLSYELGYRIIPAKNLSADIAAFYNDYDELRTIEPGLPFIETSPAPPHLVIPFTGSNKMDGGVYGVELAANWRPVDWWRFSAAYTYLQIHLHLDEDSGDTVSEAAEGESPHNQFSLRSSFDLKKDIELDLWLRYVDNLPSLNEDSYVTMDARLSWEPIKDLELSIVGQNLLDNHHPEFTQEIFINSTPTEVERSVYGKIAWRF